MTQPQPLFRPRSYDPIAADLLTSSGYSTAMGRILASRGIRGGESLDYTLSKALPVSKLTNANRMAELIADKMQAGKKFLIVADYDSDGATSCAIGIKALRGMGATVDFMVPNRFKHGYGLTPSIIEEVISHPEREKPDCIITVDNGIASVTGVAEAKKHGISVLVTDHHLAGDVIPDAECIVNPNQPGCTFPSKNLAGCGVIFYVMMAVKRELQQRGWFEKYPNFNVTELVDYVALGTVADVVKLDDNNRRLVSAGLQRMRDGKAHVGIQAIMSVASRKIDDASTFDMGFAVGPRLNAAGRLDDMSIGIACLLEEDPSKAKQLAEQLDAFNRERKSIETDMGKAAEVLLDDLSSKIHEKHSIALFDPSWHHGVIGILASRIKERTNRPTILFGRGEHGELKGSGRSIPGLHLRDTLDVVYKKNPDMIKKFGGHSMAAGLTILEKDYHAFVEAFEDAAHMMMPPGAMDLIIDTDGALEPDEMTFDFVREMQSQIWGQGFPQPVFEMEFDVLNQRQVGANKDHAKLTLSYKGIKFDGIMWNQKDPLPERINATFALEINDYQGVEKLSLKLERVLDLTSPVLNQSAEVQNASSFEEGPLGMSI